MPSDAIKNFSEEEAFQIIQNNYEGSNPDAENVSVQNVNCTFNPLAKWLDALEENKRLYEELLKSEREKVAMLQRIIEGKG